MLKLDKVSKFYSQGGVVTSGFSKVSLDFEIGEFVAVTGESGSGKSTLMNVISGLDSYEEGEIYIFGEPTSGYSEDEKEDYRRKYIGNIFQTFNLVNNYTVFQNVELVLLLKGDTKKEAKEKADCYIEKVGLGDYRNTKASKLSGGQKQRVAIARALAQDTPIIVADEPTGNLDVQSASEVIKILSEISKDKLIIIVTHNYEQVQDYVTRKITMNDGRVTEDKKLVETKSTEEERKVEEQLMQRKPKNMRGTSTARIGVRNTFSIPSKFILMLIVFIFMTVSTFGSYGGFLRSNQVSTENVFSDFFGDASPERLEVNKKDHSVITKEDIKKLNETENIKEVDTKDFMRDTYIIVNIKGANRESGEGSFSIAPLSNKNIEKRKLIRGRYPEKADEILLVYGQDDSFMNNIISKLKDDSIIEILNDYDEHADIKFKVTGLVEATKEDEGIINSPSSYHDAGVILTDEGINRLNKSVIKERFKQKIIMGERDLLNNDGEIRFLPLDGVNEGTVFIPEALNENYRNGYALNQPFSIINKTIYTEKRFDYTVAGSYNAKNIKWLLGIDKYEEGTMNIYMNVNDYNKFYELDDYQAAVIVKNTAVIKDTEDKLESMGYNVLNINEAAGKPFRTQHLVTKLAGAAGMAINLIVLFFICYFILKLIFKSRNKYFGTVRMLGGRRKNCSSLLKIDMFTVFNIAYAIFVIPVALIKNSVISVPISVMEYFAYVHVKDFVILYVIIGIMSLLLSERYSKKLFKQTAMNAYKEEV